MVTLGARAVTQYQSSTRAVPEQYQSSTRVVPEQYQSSTRGVVVTLGARAVAHSAGAAQHRPRSAAMPGCGAILEGTPHEQY